MKCLLVAALGLAIAAGGMDLPRVEVPHLTDLPVIDGRVDAEEWREAAELAAFCGAADRSAGEILLTRCRIGWTSEWLLVAFECIDPVVICGGTDRDSELHRGDVVEIFIDPVGDNMEYYEIGIAPNGAVADLKFVLGAPPVYSAKGDFAGTFTWKHRHRFRDWDLPGLKAAAAPLVREKHTIGFQVEVAIPAEVLRRRQGKFRLEPGTMRANFCRFDYSERGGEGVFSSWSQVLFGLPHSMPRRFGFLVLTEK